MRLARIALAVSLLLPAEVRAEDNAPSEWMLLLDARTMSVAPTTYSTVSECVMVSTVLNIEARLSTVCLPLHYPKDQVDAYMAARAAAEQAVREDKEAEALALKKKREEITRNRPALEAERRAILDDREKLNQKPYADRVLEIDAMLRLLK